MCGFLSRPVGTRRHGRLPRTPAHCRCRSRERRLLGSPTSTTSALSFASEQRDYVERISAELKSVGLAVFYDQDREIAATKLWGRDLGEYLDYIYREGSRFCLRFISAD